MSSLPDELWIRILEIGIVNGGGGLTYKDLCCISISSHRLHRLSSENSLWNYLLSSDFSPFPSSSSSTSATSFSSSKSLYKFRFEKEKTRRLAAHRRAVLRKQSEINQHSRRLRDIQKHVAQETIKATQTASELSNLRRVRQASVALKMWQPQVVQGRQKHMVEQCAVPVESRIHALEMELKLCKQQIVGLEKSHRDGKRMLDTAMEELHSMEYHPMHDHKRGVTGGEENEHNVKGKKLKKLSSFCKP